MKLLLIEDDELKARQILGIIRDFCHPSDIQLRSSYTSGLKELRSAGYDLILLDMSLPNFDLKGGAAEGGKFRSYGGRDLLHQMQRYKMSAKAIVITQYDSFSDATRSMSLSELSSELRDEFPQNYITAIFYSSSDETWKWQLKSQIQRLGL